MSTSENNAMLAEILHLVKGMAEDFKRVLDIRERRKLRVSGKEMVFARHFLTVWRSCGLPWKDIYEKPENITELAMALRKKRAAYGTKATVNALRNYASVYNKDYSTYNVFYTPVAWAKTRLTSRFYDEFFLIEDYMKRGIKAPSKIDIATEWLKNKAINFEVGDKK